MRPSRTPECLPSRSGMTLVEMLVATTMTLVIMGVVAQLFGMLGRGVTESRASIEMRSRLRAVAQRLRLDLEGVTAKTLPPLAPEAEMGYLEITEGNEVETGTTLLGDWDDVLMFTTRSMGEPFVGLYTEPGATISTISSPVAEVAWFCRPNGKVIAGVQLNTLYRRQLLVVEYVGRDPFLPTNASDPLLTGYTTPIQFYDDFDLSIRNEGGLLIPNSLRDLTKRESRFLHNPSGNLDYETGFPFDAFLAGGFSGEFPATSPRFGQDVILENVLAFDVKVFDPAAPLNVTTASASGEYIDLPKPSPPVTVGTPLTFPTFDTWSTHYEFNGIDEDVDGVIDEGTNGLDDDGDGVADEADERETSPPYPVALRGIEVRIRCYEPSSRQVRQVTVRHTFVPH